MNAAPTHSWKIRAALSGLLLGPLFACADHPMELSSTEGGYLAAAAPREELVGAGYTRVSLADLPRGGEHSSAMDINDLGTIVGQINSDGTAYPVVWRSSRGQPVVLAGRLSGGGAYAINAAGAIAGNLQREPFWWLGQTHFIPESGSVADLNDGLQILLNQYDQQTGNFRALLWSPTAGTAAIGTLGGGESVALALNNAGAVVGYSDDVNGVSNPFVWSESGGFIDLAPILGCSPSFSSYCGIATGVNASGQVVGYYRTTATGAADRSFLWSAANGKTDIPLADGRALAINDHGVVVGIRSGGIVWRWSPGETTVTDIDTMCDPNLPPGFGCSYGLNLGINSAGDIVGTRYTADGRWTATVWRYP